MNTETLEAGQTVDIEELRQEIDRLDAEILAAGEAARRSVPGHRQGPDGFRRHPTGAQPRNEVVIDRYSELGPDGKDLAMLLLRLGRGRLGH